MLILQVFLYDHALIELALRLVTHLQLSMIVDFYDAPALTQHKPVSFFAIPVGFVNLAYACYHLIVAAPDTRAPAAFVDFVGICMCFHLFMDWNL